jgi:hypothetical protein
MMVQLFSCVVKCVLHVISAVGEGGWWRVSAASSIMIGELHKSQSAQTDFHVSSIVENAQLNNC